MKKKSTPKPKPTEKIKKSPKAKNNGELHEPLSNFQTPTTGRVDPEASTNGRPTIEELADKVRRDLVIRYVSIDSESDYLVLNADDNNKELPKVLDGDTFKAPVHKKLKTALQKLRVHAAILADYINIESIKKLSEISADDYKKFHVTSVHFKYGKKGDSIQINASLLTRRQKAFNFTTPVEYLIEDSESAYQFVDDLIKIRQNIFDRIDKYMSGEERGDANAVGIFAETEETE